MLSESALDAQEQISNPRHRWRQKDRHPTRYGSDHRKRRARLIAERRICEACGENEGTVLDHRCAISVCGLSDFDEDYQILCRACDLKKTSAEGHAARREARLAARLEREPLLPFWGSEVTL
jgi:5-methylcytosine-specific restriction endonuclease McrA